MDDRNRREEHDERPVDRENDRMRNREQPDDVRGIDDGRGIDQDERLIGAERFPRKGDDD